MFVLSVVNCHMQSWDGCLRNLCTMILICLRTASYSGDIWCPKAHSLIAVNSVSRTKLPEWIESMMSISQILQHALISSREQVHMKSSALEHATTETAYGIGRK